jgi:two-component system, OmpR family, phosphate regulon response regulator PhoB
MAKTIMIIEDETDIRDYLMAALEDNGYQTCSIEEHEPVPEAMALHKPDMVIMDIMMPKRSGISIYKELRRSPEFSGIPVALITGVTPEVEFMSNGFRLLADDPSMEPPDGFVEKPIDLLALLRLIEKLLINKKETSLVTSTKRT